MEALQVKQDRVDKILAGESSLARKVYDSVPIRDTWSVAQIINDMRRQHGNTVTKSLVEGCLKALRQRNLIKESRPGFFIRAKVTISTKKDTDTVTIRSEKTASTETFTPTEQTPMEKLGVLADMARELSTALDEVAVELDDFLKEKSAENDKLSQLRALIKEL